MSLYISLPFWGWLGEGPQLLRISQVLHEFGLVNEIYTESGGVGITVEENIGGGVDINMVYFG